MNNRLLSLVFLFLVLICGCVKKNNAPLYRIYDGKAYGFIDSTGKTIIPPTLLHTNSFEEDLALVAYEESEGYSYYFIDRKGDTSLKPLNTSLSINPFYMYPFYRTRDNFEDSHDKMLSFLINEYSFSSGLAIVFDNKTQLFGYMNKKGEVVIRPQFTNASKFNNGYAVIQTSYDSLKWENTRVAIIDSTGKIVIPAKYYRLTHLSNGLAIGIIATKQGEGYSFSSFLLNKKGEVVNTVLGNFMCYFNSYSGGYAAVWNGIMQTFYKTPYCIIDSTGTILQNNGEGMYFEDLLINRGKYFWFKRMGKYAWFTLDEKGRIKRPDIKVYDTVKIGFNAAGIASVRFTPEVNGPSRYGYIDTLGNFILPAKYHNANNFRGALAGASLRSGPITLDGYINKKGTFVWSREIPDRD